MQIQANTNAKIVIIADEPAGISTGIYLNITVLKYSSFGYAVNITFGLPFVRTPVSHGTALDLAASGKASNRRLLETIDMAINLNRQH